MSAIAGRATAGRASGGAEPGAGQTSVRFYGGLREIGASKILVSTARARVLLDIGLPMGEGSELFGGVVHERPGRELSDRLRVNQAPGIPGLWDPALLPEQSPLRARDPRPTALFISHAHLDHIGMAGLVDPGIAQWASGETVRLSRASVFAGYHYLGREPQLQAIDSTVQVGDLRVEAVPVDHDVPGACGFIVHAPDGVLAYTGDLNFHRHGGRNSLAFAQRVHGASMLVTETTMLSFEPLATGPVRTEDDVLSIAGQACARTPGLALVSVYERDVERCSALIGAARRWGRTMVWPGAVAAFLAAMGVEGVVTWDRTRPQTALQCAGLDAALAAGLTVQTVGLSEVASDQGGYLVQLDARDMPAMLDLPVEPGAPWIHAQGEPLGPFMPDWAPFQAWLSALGLVRVDAGSTGHATAGDLTDFVAHSGAGVVVPLHGRHPERLRRPGPILLPEYGRAYALDGSVLGR